MGKPWREYYKELKAFRRCNGHCKTSEKTGVGLHHWVREQRGKRHALTPTQIERLNRIGFDWETKEMKIERMWKSNLELLKKFKGEHGHTRVPISHSKQLNSWIDTQRQNYRKCKMPADRVRRLEGIGFEWNIRGGVTDRSTNFVDSLWQERFQDYCNYLKSHPNANIPKNFTIKKDKQKAYDLNRWIGLQRETYRAGRMKQDRREKFESIGFSFDYYESENNLQTWDVWFGRLVDFKAKNGTCNVPDDWNECPRLARWVSKQRANKDKSQLSSLQLKKLARLGCFREEGNEHMLGELQEFKHKHGHCRISYDASSPLEKWAADIRNRWKVRTLDPQQMAPLNKLGFEWYPPGLPITCYDVRTAKRRIHSIERHSTKRSKKEYQQTLSPVKSNATAEQRTASS